MRKRISIEEALAIFRKTQPDFELPKPAPPAPTKPSAPPASPKPPAQMPVKRQRIVNKVRQFAKAMVDLATGNVVDDETFNKRLVICKSNQCGWLVVLGEKLYCGSCGCPKSAVSELHVKLKCPDLECPCDPPLWTGPEKKNAESIGTREETNGQGNQS